MNTNFSFQRLLWNIAGAEIPVLEKCRTDHKRFGAIGATIAMTSFIAFLSGTSAAWYFTQKGSDTSGNLYWAMAFGLVWSTLIFCIDRSLVITLKKNPDRKSKYWWAVPLASRSALAMIIAFMVSIPLELVVFEDFISEQEYFWTENRSNSLSQNSRANRAGLEAQQHIDEGSSSLKKLEGQRSTLESERNTILNEISVQRNMLNHPTTQAYKVAFNKYKAASNPANGINPQKNHYYKIMQAEILKWNEPIKEKISELEELLKLKDEEIAQKTNDINATQKQILIDQTRRTEFEKQRDSLIDEHDKTMQEGNHFIQNFEILEYAVGRQDIACTNCNGKGKKDGNSCYRCQGSGKIKSDLPTEWYFLWLIRLLFFIIELLPTVVKIVMPLGAYDRMIYAEEKDMESYLSSPDYLDRIRTMHDLEIKAHEEQLKAQSEAELAIRQQLMDKLKDAQLEIAEAAVNKWRETELERIEKESSKISTSTSHSPFSPDNIDKKEYVV